MPRIFSRFDVFEKRKNLRRNSTSAERTLWEYLRDRRFHNLKFRRQFSVGRYILDFYCVKLRLAIEVDGDSHFAPRQAAYDLERTEWLKSVFIRVVRFTNLEVLKDLEGVLSELEHIVTAPNPSSPEEGSRHPS